MSGFCLFFNRFVQNLGNHAGSHVLRCFQRCRLSRKTWHPATLRMYGESLRYHGCLLDSRSHVPYLKKSVTPRFCTTVLACDENAHQSIFAVERALVSTAVALGAHFAELPVYCHQSFFMALCNFGTQTELPTYHPRRETRFSQNRRRKNAVQNLIKPGNIFSNGCLKGWF